MGNVQMNADQIRYKDSSGAYRNVQAGLAAAIAGGGGGSGTLAGLTDTDITTPTNGQVLAYDSTEAKWVNAASASGATTLEGLTDTAITSAADGQVLTYDSTAEKWENAAIPAQSIDGLSDTTISEPSDGQVLSYDNASSKWVNATPASGVTTLAALTDTAIITPSDGQVLTYDSANSKWVNASGGSGGGGEVYPAVGTEVKIGTWRGQDLYRRVFCGEVAGNSNGDLGSIDGTYYVTNLYGSYAMSFSAGKTRWNFPDFQMESSVLKYRKLSAVPVDNSYVIRASNQATGYITDLEVVVEYTKTTPPQPTP